MNLEYEHDLLERFIPVSVDELIDDLSTLNDSPEAFRTFATELGARFHSQMYQKTITLHRSYYPFNPDRDTVTRHEYPTHELESAKQKFLEEIADILDAANFEALTLDKLSEALSKTSPYGVEVYVNIDEFSVVKLFYRGTAVRRDKRRDWRSAYTKHLNFDVPIYRRLVMIVQPKEPTTTHLAVSGKPMYIKIFKNIPHSDLETLFPNTRVRIRTFDKLKLALTGGGGTVGGIMATVAKLSAAANPMTIIFAVAGFAAVLWRQIAKVFSQRAKYMAKLAENLYFYTLANNAGALAFLVELAASSECKETLLAYHFLSTAKASGMTAGELDAAVERYIAEQFGIAIDYEVRDGLRKLERLELTHRNGDRYYIASAAAR